MGYERPKIKIPERPVNPLGLDWIKRETDALIQSSRLARMPDYVEYLGEHEGYQLIGEYSQLYGGNKNFGVQVLRYNHKDSKERVFWKGVMEEEEAKDVLKNWDVSQIQR